MVIKARDYQYTTASNGELDQLLAGREAGISAGLSQISPQFLQIGSTGVIWRRGESGEAVVRPIVLLVREDEVRRLCGRYAKLRSDLSPLSAWCHLVTPNFVESVDSLWKDPDLGGMDAAWAGLVVAESSLVTERQLAAVRLPTCLASQTFAVARSMALWPRLSVQDVLQRFDDANRLHRSDAAVQRRERLRNVLRPMWSTLRGLGFPSKADSDLRPVIDGINALKNARARNDSNEVKYFVEPFLGAISEAHEFVGLDSSSPEQRLRLFDRLVGVLATSASAGTRQRNAVGALAGYLATVVAGGRPSLTLVESQSQRWPELLCWAYLIGGVGERVVWTSSFDGLGRLICRELSRPLNLDEPPSCDFALEEAMAVADSQLSDPLVHLRIKQSRVVTVALSPGVNVSVAIGDASAAELGKGESRANTNQDSMRGASTDNVLSALANALWPYLESRMQSRSSGTQSSKDYRNRNKRRQQQPRQEDALPLSNAKK